MRALPLRSRRGIALAVSATLAPLTMVSLAAPVAAHAATCAQVTIIGVRGSSATAGTGGTTHNGSIYVSGGLANVQPAASDINAGTALSVHYEGVYYPAAILPTNPLDNFSNYFSSEGTGVTNLRKDIEYDASHCPSSKIVLLGLSQGAQVVGDVLDKTTPTQLSAAAKGKIVAAGLWGDPEFKAGETYDTGTYKGGDGAWPRGKTNLSTFASRLRDFCLDGDSMCQANWVFGWGVHGTYGNASYQQSMANWVLTKL
ncbi:hypothetical protein acdb102_19340 [Acidothermaceae bacterium B102]|nr:hypothetical protein acdb102_19340 [Acidothermaceae bacterium B102]